MLFLFSKTINTARDIFKAINMKATKLFNDENVEVIEEAKKSSKKSYERRNCARSYGSSRTRPNVSRSPRSA